MAKLSSTHIYGDLYVDGAIDGKVNKDSAGQQINTTYIKGLSVSGKTITYTKGDGTTGTITTQDTNTTYSAATQSAAGLMSAADKKKLDGVATSANNYSHPNSGVTASSYGPSANASPAHGKTFSVPYITVNAAGHITAASTKTITLPTDNNTWRGVQNNLTSTATDQSLSAAQGKILQDNKADKTLLGEDLSSKTISLNDLNLSSGSPKFKVYYCPTDGGGSNITGRPNDSSKQAFNLIIESLRWASTTDYITKQTYTQGSQKIIYVRYCTNGTWSAWEKVYTSGQKPTAADIGAAKASHGTHLTIGTGASNAAAGNHTHSGYASSSHTHTNIMLQDTRDVNTTPDGAPVGLSVHLKNNAADGLSDGGTYHSSLFIKGWDDYSGGPYGNIAISANNNLWFRASSSGTAWNSWKKVSVYGHTHSYLPLSGGTLTGNLTISGNSKSLVLGTGGSDIYLKNDASGKYLQLKDNGTLTYDDKTILHSSNYNSYALPLSGGTLSGPITVSGESRFHNGTYSDPWSGTGCAIKATGNVGITGTLRTNTGIYSISGNGVATSDGSTYAALLRYKDSRGYCDLGNNKIPGRLYIRSGQGTAGSGVLVECAVTNGNAYMQYLSPEAGTIALTRHLSDRTRKDNIVYVGSKDSKFTNKDFYDFIRDDLGLATYNYNKEYKTTDTHTKLNFIAQDILYDIEHNCENKVGNLIVQAEDAMEQQGSLRYDPEVFTSVIAGALKESINKIEEDNEKIKTLENEVKELEAKNKVLEELVYSMNERLLKLEDK